MASLTSLEGEADFPCPQAGKPCKTWYKIVGSLTANPSIRPLVLVNGGPGMSHHLLDNLTALNRLYSIPLIFYDQLGSGSSTHLPERLHDTSFWVVQLFVDELHNLVSHLGLTEYDILGSSWGGMLAAQFAASQPKGLQRLAIANSAADLQLRYDAANEYRRELPQEVQDVLQRHEDAGTTDSKEYNEAYGVLFKKHICKVSPLPNYLLECIEEAKKDNTVVLTMYVRTFHSGRSLLMKA
jgi:proline-specific peptidase